MAICSKPGIHWISDRVGGTQYTRLANEFADQMGFLQQLEFTGEKAAEPDEQTARTWMKGAHILLKVSSMAMALAVQRLLMTLQLTLLNPLKAISAWWIPRPLNSN